MAGKANDTGPDWYRTSDGGEQVWDRAWRLYGRGPFIFSIEQYIERYHMKDGLNDLLKAQHYLTKLIELETLKQANARPNKYESGEPSPRPWDVGAGPEQFEHTREEQDEQHRSLMASSARYDRARGQLRAEADRFEENEAKERVAHARRDEIEARERDERMRRERARLDI